LQAAEPFAAKTWLAWPTRIRGQFLRQIFIVGLIAVLAAPVEAEQPVAIFSQSVSLDSRGAGVHQAGQLTYRGGIVLHSRDPRFGGFSALHVSVDGSTALAISDRGAWVRLRLLYDTAGHLAGVIDGRMGELIGENGKVLIFPDNDAEALAVFPDGSMLVAFERNHRILRYPAASPPFSKAPVRIPVPAMIKNGPANLGLEAIASMGDGRLLAISELLVAADGSLSAWIGRAGAWKPFTYASKPGFRVADSGFLPDGDLVVLEHFIFGNVSRLVRVKRDSLATGRRVEGREIATLRSPLITENFEGLSIRRGKRNEALLYLISDDNFKSQQRTILLMFALHDGDTSRAPE
jgi:hypothetical protein